MTKYTDPHIEILLFDEEEILANPSNTHAARELNKYMFGESIDAAGTTTVTLEKALSK